VGLGWTLINPLNVKLLYSYLYLYYNLIKKYTKKTGGGGGTKKYIFRKYPPKKVPPIGGRFLRGGGKDSKWRLKPHPHPL